jgi:hypothetical protein
LLAAVIETHGHEAVYDACLEVHGFPPFFVYTEREAQRVIDAVQRQER